MICRTKSEQRWKIILCVLGMIIVVAALTPIVSQAEEVGEYYWDDDFGYRMMSDHTYEIVAYNGSQSDIELPSSAGGHTVTAVDVRAFREDWCDINKIVKIYIPESISIESNPFSECINLETIKVSPEHSTLAVIDNVLFNKIEKTLVSYPRGLKLAHYSIPDGIKKIGLGAFGNCSNLESISIPDSVESIETAGFYKCTGLKEITIPGSVRSIGLQAFRECSDLKEVDISEGCEVIESGAFWFCDNLEEVDLPSSLKVINHHAFSDCPSLKEIVIPEGVEKIDLVTFRNCIGLEKVTIPETVKEIVRDPFEGCSDSLIFTVERGSVAADFCKEKSKEYTYFDALDWLN